MIAHKCQADFLLGRLWLFSSTSYCFLSISNPCAFRNATANRAKGGKLNKDEKPGVTVVEYSLGAVLCPSLEILKAQSGKAQSKLNFWHWPCFEHGVGPESSRGPSSLRSQMSLWLQAPFSGPEVPSPLEGGKLTFLILHYPGSQNHKARSQKKNHKKPNPFFQGWGDCRACQIFQFLWHFCWFFFFKKTLLLFSLTEKLLSERRNSQQPSW